ncbi:MAG: tRNA guanosine(34) transglycosylase Tgt [Balneolales bacterium]
MFSLQKECSQTKARTGILQTDHGAIETPIFMPVGTLATVKAVTGQELLHSIKAQIILGNTYHLFLRPGNDIISMAGGIHQFMNWDRPLLTDSGGYQVFSLAANRKLNERGVIFKSHLDGSKHEFTPENVIATQRILGSDIMMTLDECPPYPAPKEYVENSMNLTNRWALRCKQAQTSTESLYGHKQFLFGITQGGSYGDLRKSSTKSIADLEFEGNAIGGLSVGEPSEFMYEMTDISTDILPKDKPRYLMGVGTPSNLLESIARGVDMFDCVMPTRNARNGMIFTRQGSINLKNAKWKTCFESADADFESDLCQQHSLAYLHHLTRTGEILGMRLASVHNLTFFLWLMKEARMKIDDGIFATWYPKMAKTLDTRL